MFWKRSTTTTVNPISAPYGPPAAPIVQAVPLASVADPAITNAPTYNRAYAPVVAVPVAGVATAGTGSVATAGRTYQPEVKRSYALVRLTEFIWLLAGVLEALFAVRIILNLIGANQAAGFAQFITRVTTPFLAPFANLMSNPTTSSGSVLEITTLIAMMVYALLAWGIVRLLQIVFARRYGR
jgi:hypothetical protein